MELFLQVVTGHRGEFRILPNLKDEVFAKIVKNQKSLTIFAKPPSWMLEKVLNMLLD